MTKAATRLFQSYPRTDYDDPKEALASYVTVLTGYSDGIVMSATSIETGIQRTSKFPPRISELVEFCDKLMARLANYERMKNWGRQTVADRLLLEQNRENRPTLEQLKEKYGGSLLPKDFGGSTEISRKPPKAAPSWAEIVKHYNANPDRVDELMGRPIQHRPVTTEEPQHDLSLDPVPDGPESERSKMGGEVSQGGSGAAPQTGRPRGPKAQAEIAETAEK